ncbi:hypothetical protein MNBD_ALPHA08-1015 [hydrothermal vent metagenome]|uniref:VWFA domain-containing protein n=1 Tax=hydrothermal vent metagenome TaxID=652676 RepID=A0A3B0RG45_9ZZZZ
MRKIFYQLTIVVFAIFVASTSLRAQQQDVMVVLDASGSMWGQIDGKPKINIAREVMSKVLRDLDGTANIGVMAYGHRKKGDCGDIETIIPVGKVNQARYMSVINSLSPKGKTPITRSVRMAAEELRYTENKATVVLISDGLETCQANACAMAKELEKLGVDFTVHVVGFDLKNKDTSSLQCLARETGGKYLAADNADELGDAINSVVAEATQPEPEPVQQPEPQPVDEPTILKVDILLAPGSKPLESGATVYIVPEAGNRQIKNATSRGPTQKIHKVKPGTYYIEAKVKNIVSSTTYEVKAGQENRAEIILNAGLLRVIAVPEEGGKPLEQAYIYIQEPVAAANGKRKRITAANQRNTFTLAAGKYYAVAVNGKATAGQEVEVIAGKLTETTIILAAGVLQVSVLAQEGGKPQTSGSYVYIYENEKQASGKRKQITAASPRNKFTLPQGTYYVVAKIGKATVGKTIEVVAGKLTEATIVVGVGALKVQVIPAEGGKPLKKAYITILEKEKQLTGKRKTITAGNQRQTFKLPAGEYFIVGKIDQARVSQEITISAGKLTEIILNANAGALQVTAPGKTYVTIFSGEKNLDGSRDLITSFRPRQPIMLPAGKFVLKGKDGSKIAEATVEIKAGKLTEVSLDPQ